jgi:site-specific DNA recombinase
VFITEGASYKPYKWIDVALRREHIEMKKQSTGARARLERQLEILREHMDSAYTDKLDGKISDEFWTRKQCDWQSEESRLKEQIAGLNRDTFDDRLLDVSRILELAQKPHSLYVTRKPAEQAELLMKVLLNSSIDAVSLYPTYRKPFDLIFKRARNEEWSTPGDVNPCYRCEREITKSANR